jgi:hypothetical protein
MKSERHKFNFNTVQNPAWNFNKFIEKAKELHVRTYPNTAIASVVRCMQRIESKSLVTTARRARDEIKHRMCASAMANAW